MKRVVVLVLIAVIFVSAFDGPEVGTTQRNERIGRVWNKGRRLGASDIVTLTGS